MPTRRFSTMSMRPQPYAPTMWFSSVDELDQAQLLAVDARPARPLEADRRASRGSVAVGLVSDHTPWRRHRPRVLHLAALDGPPQRLSSIEYTFSFVAGIGMSWR